MILMINTPILFACYFFSCVFVKFMFYHSLVSLETECICPNRTWLSKPKLVTGQRKPLTMKGIIIACIFKYLFYLYLGI